VKTRAEFCAAPRMNVSTVPTAVSARRKGELLYSTQCIACHTSQGHWRDGKLATNWSSLRAEVRRRQATGMLQQSEEDVLHVTRSLNDTFNGFRRPPAR
jgi:mono/diheme cytochrome c family protein